MTTLTLEFDAKKPPAFDGTKANYEAWIVALKAWLLIFEGKDDSMKVSVTVLGRERPAHLSTISSSTS